MSIFKLPDLGEGLPEAEIVEWHVKVGDEVKLDQPIVSMETAKAIVEVPSPHSGKVTKLYGEAGDTILTGAPLIEFIVEGMENNSSKPEEKRKDTGTVAGKIEATDNILEEEIITIRKSNSGSGIKATPAVRALAKKLKVDLNNVTPTGANNTITSNDVKLAAESTGSSKQESNIEGFEPLKGVRKSMAYAMVKSHKEIVPVTVCDDAKLVNWSDNEDITIRIIKAIVAGCKQEPSLNAYFNGDNLARKVFNEVNLGIAMDTPDGLFVPVIKDIANKSASELRAELNQLKIEVKNRTVPQQKLHDATITLSNFGKFIGRYASPIVVPPQVAIIGAGAIKEEPIAVDGKVIVGKVLPISISIDHRAVTGGEATRFLSAIISSLEE